MLFKEFVRVYRINITRFAETLNISRALLAQILGGTRSISLDLAERLEKQSQGIMTAEEILKNKAVKRPFPKVIPNDLYTPVEKWPKLRRRKSK